MLNTRQREKLARQHTPPEPKQPLRIKFPKGFYWLGLTILTPLMVPALVLVKEFRKPFKKQRY